MADELDLVREERRELATAVIEAAGNPTEPFGMYIFTADQPESALARSVEREVFDEWFGNSSELLDAEYGAYEPSTVFFSVLDQRRCLPVGMLRVTLPSPQGFKTMHDLESVWGHSLESVLPETGIEWDLERVWDTVTIAVAGEYRGKATDGLITMSLLQSLAQALLLCNGRTLITILDLEVLELFQTTVCQPWQRFPGVEPKEYLDSPASVPVYTDFDEYEPRMAATDPATHELIFRARGFEAAMRPPEWDTILAAAGLAELARPTATLTDAVAPVDATTPRR